MPCITTSSRAWLIAQRAEIAVVVAASADGVRNGRVTESGILAILPRIRCRPIDGRLQMACDAECDGGYVNAHDPAEWYEIYVVVSYHDLTTL
jgi:hypothetical protein